MALNSTFAVVPRIGVVAVATANTGRDGSGTLATALTAASTGTRIERVVLSATNDPAASMVTMFLHDGTTAWYFAEFNLSGNPAAATTTNAPFREERAFDFTLPSGWSIRFAITVALTAGNINAFVFGADL